jgi:hypothetical protein
MSTTGVVTTDWVVRATLNCGSLDGSEAGSVSVIANR